MTDSQQRNIRRTTLWAVALVVGMTALSFAAVPLYDLFCRVTGFGGTTQKGELSNETLPQTYTVQFNADLNPNLPWEFEPLQRKVSAHVGENMLIFYRAKNISDKPVSGTATFNVTPFQAGQHFVKVECFCFQEQKLQPGEEIEMPVSFHIDKGVLKDKNMEGVTTLTLSYTFFPYEEEKARE